MIHRLNSRSIILILLKAGALSLTALSCSPGKSNPATTRSSTEPVAEFTPQEIRRIRSHSPLPPVQDPTNRFLNNESAARLGRDLFFDARLSANGRISCATCHDPAHGFADGKPFAEGLQTGRRHTPSLWNAAYNRWFFWDGRADSLWAQALHPIESPAEMGSSRLALAHLVGGEVKYRGLYENAFAQLPPLSDSARFPAQAKPASAADPDADVVSWTSMSAEDQAAANQVFVNIGKALAAYESKIVSRRSPFDLFVEGLTNGDAKKMAALSPDARRGLKLFVGKANCRSCHMGSNFTDGEFHDTRVPPREGGPPFDPGRFKGTDEVMTDPFNARGAFSDQRTGSVVEFLVNNPENWGRFKTPTLRNVARTAPYMHQGQFATLTDVVRYYSTLEQAMPAGHHAETILQPLLLSDNEIRYLVAFLESLTDENIAPEWLGPDDANRSNSGPQRH